MPAVLVAVLVTAYVGYRTGGSMAQGGEAESTVPLFLQETTEGPGRWVGFAEPWRFALRSAQVSVESKWEAAAVKFPVRDESEFLAQVRGYADQQ